MSFTSDELNYLIYRYLKEAGFEHSAFTFGNESRVAVDRISVAPSDVIPGTLVYVVQKGLQYLEVESTICEDGNEVELEESINLLTPYNAKRKSPANNTNEEKDKKRKRDKAKAESNKMMVEYDSKDSKKSLKTSSTKSPSAVNSVLISPSQVSTLEGHTSEVFQCSWNPKFPIIASCSADATARYWTVPDMPCGKKSAEDAMKSSIVLKHMNAGKIGKDVTTIDWNNNGNLLGTGTVDGVVRIWDLKGKCKYTLDKHEGAIFSLKWSKNGEYLLSGSVDKSAIVWDANSGFMKQQFKFHSLATLDIDWKNNDTFASCSRDKSIFICQIGQQEPLREFKAHEDEVNAVRWSPDGRLLASCSDDKSVKLWSIDQQKPLFSLTDHTKEIYTLKWSPTGPGTKNPNANVLLASASFDSTVKLWDVNEGKCTQTLLKHSDAVYSVSFSPCGQYLASGAVDRNIHIYSVKDGKHLKTFKGPSGIFEVCWNSAGDKLAACFTNNSVCVLDFKV